MVAPWSGHHRTTTFFNSGVRHGVEAKFCMGYRNVASKLLWEVGFKQRRPGPRRKWRFENLLTKKSIKVAEPWPGQKGKGCKVGRRFKWCWSWWSRVVERAEFDTSVGFGVVVVGAGEVGAVAKSATVTGWRPGRFAFSGQNPVFRW